MRQWPGATRAVATFGMVVTWATCKVVVGFEPTGLFAWFIVFCFTYRALCQYQGTAAYLGTPGCVSAFHAALPQIVLLLLALNVVERREDALFGGGLLVARFSAIIDMGNTKN